MTRLLILVRRTPELDAFGFASRVDELARPLVRASPSVALYLPDATTEAVAHPFPKGRSFDAMIDLTLGDGVEASRALPSNSVEPHAVYRVEERRLKTYARDWPDGVPSPGLFLVSAVRRAVAMDASSFDAHWRDRHGPLALRHHTGMWDYRQSVVVECLTPGATPFDGVARLGFRSTQDFETGLFGSREGRKALAEDTVRFCDVERTEVALLREMVLKS